jgi:uncharacterized UPF0160 family protein
MTTIVTHSRRFHNDELMAIVLLQTYVITDKFKLVRTRDEKLLQSYKADPEVFVIDVGFEYDVANKNFDHHQDSFQQKWDDGTSLSSCGVVWKWLKETKVLHQKMNDETMTMIENDIIKKIDAQDNGEGFWAEGAYLSLFNRNHHDDKVIDSQFKRALAAANSHYMNYFYHLRAKMTDEKKIHKDIKSSEAYKNTVVFKSKLTDGVGTVAELTDKAWIVMPHKKGSFKIQAVPESKYKPHTQRIKAPKEWCGLERPKLQQVSGIKNLIFCHKNGFMLLFEGELKEALWLTEGLLTQ